ncbi:hypothetical protein L226DRAFT_526539 [Lentinus tigrinus ALCF2SS1-7]|uniref:Uncharacterized protein n=1 Tax=Lentinus tigrinus ALCF2SS1-6 TaxID=1328759 RepID=A0A5C2SAE7_9APHY|nr:hypothetical protein L227DRAFT_563533 [Lentinus tigrinus ALCF2SS1-6]RPD69523.1 hypothetical protein L226DRAFT_526539 [Lentinus tigrinus ALCF2SS1-7]
MPRCRRRTVSGDNGRQTRCTKRPPGNKQYCQEHYKEYRRQTDAYKKATREAEELEVPVDGLMARGVSGIKASEEVAMNEEIVRTYADCLERAIRGREDHHKEFFVEADAAHKEYLDMLRRKRENALAFLDIIEARRQTLWIQAAHERKRQQETERRQQELEKARLRRLEEEERLKKVERDRAKPSTKHAGVMARCAAHLAYEEHTRCAVPVPVHQRFCHAHRDEHRAASDKVELAALAAQKAEFKVDETCRRRKSGEASFQDMIADIRSYLDALDEQLQVVEAHQQRFQCKGAVCHESEMAELKSRRDKVKQTLETKISALETVESIGELVVGAIASGVGAYFGIPWGRTIALGAMAAFGMRSTRGGGRST